MLVFVHLLPRCTLVEVMGDTLIMSIVHPDGFYCPKFAIVAQCQKGFGSNVLLNYTM